MKKQILIVDDDMHLSDSIADYLNSQNFLVRVVHDVPCALQKIQENKPDLIISDIMMPDTDGYDFIRILRLDNALATIPIIFLTAKGMTQDRIKGYNLGCNAYLTKPFNPEELLSIIFNIFQNINLWQIDQRAYSNEGISAIASSYKLTDREMTVLRLVIKGHRNKEIAEHLNVSLRNVEKYVSRLLFKTSMKNRTQLAQLFAAYDI